MFCSSRSTEYEPADAAAPAGRAGAAVGAGRLSADRSTAPGRENGCCVMALSCPIPLRAPQPRVGQRRLTAGSLVGAHVWQGRPRSRTQRACGVLPAVATRAR